MTESTKKKHFWCVTCHIPLLKNFCFSCDEEGREIVSDLKPVFKEEFQYYKDVAVNRQKISEKFFPKILYRHRNRLISDVSKGLTHFKVKIQQNVSDEMEVGEFAIFLEENPNIKGRSKTRKYFLDDPTYIDKLIKGNLKYLQEIESEAIKFIKSISDKYSKYFKLTSFSGGKDSTVVAALVQQAIGDIPIVFSDTGIEYPETENYVKTQGNDFGKFLFLDCEVDFLEMCKKLGPPSRTMRWCCFTNKGAPFSKYYANIEHKHVLSFDGIRREESNLRSNYPREMDNTKYEKQHSAYPILYWSTLEVWLYIVWKKLSYNRLYDHGFSRIGCWACPNNTKFDWFLFSKVYPEMAKDWFSLINDYRTQQNITMETDEDFGKTKDGYDLSWVEDGDWKSRRVKYHNVDNLDRLESPCGKHDFDLYLKNSLPQNFIEFLKVFGTPSETSLPSSQKMYRVIHDDFIISYLTDSNAIKFYIQDENKTEHLKRLLLRQINKSFNCVDCGACVGSCAQGAISINPHFHIDEEKCVNCLICTGTKYIKMSCIALHYKENRVLLKLRSI